MTLRPGFAALLLIFISLGVYYPTIFAPFNSLDDQLLVKNLLNQESFSFSRHFTPGGTYDYFRPLLSLTFEIDKYAGGLQESFMHFVNILLHTLNVVLVFILARRFQFFVNLKGTLLPFLSAAFFALHPINTEAVNWIAGRTDLLAGTFVFASIICILTALERHSLFWGTAGAVMLFCGSLCKETALFLVPGIFLLMIWHPQKDKSSWSKRWILFAFCLTAVAGYFALRWGAYATDRGMIKTAEFVSHIATGHSSTSVGKTAGTAPNSFLPAVSVVFKVTGFYASKLFQPLPLNFAINHVNSWFQVPGVMVALILSVLACRRRPIGIFFVLSALLGSCALLVVFTRLAWTPIAERYMYIPCGFFAVAVVFGVSSLIERIHGLKICQVIVPLILAGAMFITVNRNILWQDNLLLYQDTVKKSPDFGPAKNGLAQALYSRNQPDEARRIFESAIIPDGQAASLNKAAILAEEGRYAEAREILTKRLLSPGDHQIRILTMLVKTTSAMAEKIQGQTEKRVLYQEIIGWLERLEKLTHDPFHWYQLGRVYLILNNRHEAQRCFNEAARRFPDDSIYKAPSTKLARKLAS